MSDCRMFTLALAVAVGGASLLAASGQQRTADRIPATGGDITIVPIGHATLQIAHGGIVIDVDPVAQADYAGLPQPDLILVTDIHGDHLDPEAIQQRRKESTRVVAPRAAADRLDSPVVLANGETTTAAGVLIEAVPMYNLVRGPAEGQLFHDKGRGNGYVLTLGGKRIYIAGDTECTPEMRALQDIDVAFVPMNLPYTMTPGEAAECVRAFSPDIVYPYHFRGQDVAVFANALRDTPVEVRVRSWY